ncbi:-hydroxytryptamine receptor 3A-like [Xyrichtys novacula]|uniref:-hydroxytryptamine receptor 3A-like n=1 Tax=Xyrichtys novacula TaxID=13765 RepID=A0AAV1EVD4_XYRNO|nr:-hydroxytryptamine receptor 3A-like [Xyrichtys novacula]
MTRPVKNHSEPTEVELDMLLYAILDVKEKEQKFMSYVWIDLYWKDEYIQWKQEDFCNITHISLPTQLLWKPDIAIIEMTEKNKVTQSPYLRIFYNGRALLKIDMVLITTCKLQVYKFPFDTQSCNLTFKSVIHKDYEIQLVLFNNSKWTTNWSKEMTGTQSDWLLISITSIKGAIHKYGISRSLVVYTITMKRRPVLYIVNFILPVMLFLCLDLASFMISESGGEKLSFKVTVLLAVTVMQLILNEILPSSSDKIPVIVVFCIGIFGLMMLSLLETILVMHLMEKDSVSKESGADKDQNQSERCGEKQGVQRLLCCSGSAGETPSQLLPLARQVSSGQLTGESHDSEKEVMTGSSRKEDGPIGYWTRMAKAINKVFFIFYLTTVCLFVVSMFYSWIKEEEEM